jgi:hypothetical protein
VIPKIWRVSPFQETIKIKSLFFPAVAAASALGSRPPAYLRSGNRVGLFFLSSGVIFQPTI